MPDPSARPGPILELDTGRIDLATGRGTIDGAPVRLTSLERRFLERLTACPGVAVPNSALLVDVWEASPSSPTRAMEALVRRLRKKLGERADDPVHLHTERGVGFRFVPLPAVPDDADLIGRSADVDAIRTSVRKPGVTVLVGPGGVGKTRLARSALPDACFVDLGGSTDLDGFEQHVAMALELRDAPTPQSVRDALGGRVLILDNFEQLPDTVSARVATLGEHTSIVVTSQRDIGHGRVLHVEPLSSGDAANLMTRRLDRVGATLSANVIRLAVDRVEGLPLAIEILAPLLALGGSAVAELDLLDLPNERGEPHHVSLGAVYERSWKHRAPAEQYALRTLALFTGRFDLAAAAVVLQRDVATAVQVLRSMVDTSWIQSDGGLFWMLDSARAFLRRGPIPVEARGALDRYLADLVRGEGRDDLDRLDLVERHADDLFLSLARTEGQQRRHVLLALLDLSVVRRSGTRLVGALSAVLQALPATHPDHGFFNGVRLRATLLGASQSTRQALALEIEALHSEGKADSYACWTLALCRFDDPAAYARWARRGLERIEEAPLAARIRLRMGMAVGSGDDALVRSHLARGVEEAIHGGFTDHVPQQRLLGALHMLKSGAAHEALALLETVDAGARYTVIYDKVLVPALLATGQHQRARAHLEDRIDKGQTSDSFAMQVLMLGAIELGHGDTRCAIDRVKPHLSDGVHAYRSVAIVVDALARNIDIPPLPDPVLDALHQDWREGRVLQPEATRVWCTHTLIWLFNYLG